MQLWEFLWEFCWGLFAESRKLGRNYPRRGEYQPPAHKDPSSEFKEAAECWEESASATSKHTQILPESYLRNVKSEVWIVKVHFVLPLALKSSYLAAIVFLKLTVRNVYATVILLVACFEDTSFCGKLQLRFLSPAFDALLLRQGFSPQLSHRSGGSHAVVAGVRGPWPEDAQAQPGFATLSCVIMTHCLSLFSFYLFLQYLCQDIARICF